MSAEIQISPDEHLKSVSLPSPVLGGLAGVIALLAAALSYWVVGDQVPGLLCSAADLFACLSAFLMGNTFRLRDIRSRAGFVARQNGQDPITTLSILPPQHIVVARMRVARLGLLASICMLVGAFLTIAFTQESARSIAAIAILGLVAATICYLCGMWSRPID